jgi:hypothetical protein
MDDPFSAVIEEICSMFAFGFSPMEIVWKRRNGDTADRTTRSRYSDGMIGIRSLGLRAQNTVQRWEFDEDGTILGLWQQPFTKPLVFIPIEKMLLFRTTRLKNNPEGISAIRTAYVPWFYKKRIEEIEAIGIERDLAGYPVAEIPGHLFNPDADATDKKIFDYWKTAIKNVRRNANEGLLIPSDVDPNTGKPLFNVRLLSTGGSRSFDTTRVVDRYDHRIAGSLLADFILLGQQSVGSFSLSSDKTALFATALGGFMRSIADVFNRDLLPKLWFLNALDPEVMPELIPGDLEHANLVEIGDFLSKMTAAGAQMFPDRELENHLREAAGFPLAPEDSAEDLTDPRYQDAVIEEPAPVVPPEPPVDMTKVIRLPNWNITFARDEAGNIVNADVSRKVQS